MLRLCSRWSALLVAPPVPLSRVKLVGHAAAAGLAALALSLAFPSSAGIELTRQLGVGAMLLERDEPFVLALLDFLLEGGVFLLAIPLAFLSGHKRQTLSLRPGSVLAAAPLFAMFGYVEARYLATNLIALAGPNVMLTESFGSATTDCPRLNCARSFRFVSRAFVGGCPSAKPASARADRRCPRTSTPAGRRARMPGTSGRARPGSRLRPADRRSRSPS